MVCSNRTGDCITINPKICYCEVDDILLSLLINYTMTKHNIVLIKQHAKHIQTMTIALQQSQY